MHKKKKTVEPYDLSSLSLLVTGGELTPAFFARSISRFSFVKNRKTTPKITVL